MRLLVLISMPLLPLISACQTFVDVNTSGLKPVFAWRAGAPVTGLTVLADEDCDAVKGKSTADRVWWQISGELKSPVTYGVTPHGATELAQARVLTHDCSPYTVTVTDPSFRGESSKFRP